MNKIYKVLFFTGMVPTSEQRMEALNFGPHVNFRNAAFIKDEDNPEDCDAVYGDVPAKYAARFPWACSIVDFYNGKLETVAMAPPEPVEPPPVSGAGDADTFDPFAATEPGTKPGVDWTPQG